MIKMKAKTRHGKTIVKEQFAKDVPFVCPACKKPLKGVQTTVMDSLIALDKHTTQKHKVQCCSEECAAKFYDKQLRKLEE
jgi:ribosomal protein L34E